MNRSSGVSMGGLNKNQEHEAVRPQLQHLFIDNKYFSDPWHDSEFMEVRRCLGSVIMTYFFPLLLHLYYIYIYLCMHISQFMFLYLTLVPLFDMTI